MARETAIRLRSALPATTGDVLRLAAVAAVYVLAGKAGLSLASVHPSATAVWAPTGLAIAALLLGGPRLWPGVLAGAFLVNATTAGTLATSLGIAAGNTLEALAGALLVGRFARGAEAFERAGSVFRYAVLVAVACVLSATVGVTSLALGGAAAWSDLAAIWGTWWLGDLGGALVVAPVVVLGARQARTLGARGAVRVGALVAAAVTVGLLVFGGTLAPVGRAWPLEFLVLPLVVGAAFWLGPLGAAAATAALSGVAAAGTAGGLGPFGAEGGSALLLLQAFMGVVSLTGLALGAVVHERARIAAELRRARDGLEVRVAQRTASLGDAVEALRREVEGHQRAEEALRRRDAQLTQAQRIAGLGMWDWDVPADRVTWSDALYRIYGLAPGEAPVGYRSFVERLHPEDRPRIEATIGASLQSGDPFSFEHRIVRPGGEIRQLSAAGEVIRDAQGRVRMLGIARDVTEERRAEDLRRAAFEHGLENRRLHELNQVKTDFINAAAHELNTPLTPILLQLRLLGDPRADHDQRERAVRVLRRNVDRMSQLIQDMLDVARLQSGRLRLRVGHVRLAEVAEEVAATFQDLAAERGVALDVQVPRDLQLEADATRLAQVLNNLVSNALKFTPAGGRVALAARCDGGEAVLTVTDTGDGLRADQLERLFQPFSQVHDQTGHRAVGTGLGLYISKGIVEQHGGRVWAASDGPGKGATFGVALPLQASPTIGVQPYPKTPP